MLLPLSVLTALALNEAAPDPTEVGRALRGRHEGASLSRSW
ncbi:hypothetical protein [Streptomyces longispororuber]